MKTTTNIWLGLTSENVGSILGKTIKWKAPSAKGNEGYGGIFYVNEITNSGKINGIALKGDDLKYSYLDGIHYSYSDDDRFVTFQIQK